MVAKKKYDSQFNTNLEDDCSVDLSGNGTSKLAPNHMDSGGRTVGGCSDSSMYSKVDKNDLIWEENASKMPFNLKNKTLN